MRRFKPLPRVVGEHEALIMARLATFGIIAITMNHSAIRIRAVLGRYSSVTQARTPNTASWLAASVSPVLDPGHSRAWINRFFRCW